MRKLLNKSIRHGAVTGVSTNKLIDASADFLSGIWPVRIGDMVILEVDNGQNLETTVTGLDSDTQLSLASNIFTTVGQKYRVVIGDVYIVGTTTSTGTRKLIDSGAAFLSSGVRKDMLVVNKDNGLYAWVESVSEHELELSKNIFTGTQRYEVYSGDILFQRECDELMTRKFLIVGDDSEVSTASITPVKLKELLCASSSNGYLLKGLRFVYEAKVVDGGVFTITTKVNSETIGTNTVSSSSYSIYTLSYDELFADGTVLDIDIFGHVSTGTGYIRLTEIYAIV